MNGDSQGTAADHALDALNSARLKLLYCNEEGCEMDCILVLPRHADYIHPGKGAEHIPGAGKYGCRKCRKPLREALGR